MTLNETLIINAGLFAIGAKKIFAPSDNTKAARLASTIYRFCQKLVFDMPIDWKWAMARSGALAQLTDPPTGFDHQYGPLPDNSVRAVSMVNEGGDDVEYTFEEGLLIDKGDTTSITKTLQTNVDATEVFIKYIVFIEDEAMYPAWFAQLISLYIALYVSEPIKQHTPHYNKVKDMLANAITMAEEANGMRNVRTSRTTRQSIDKGNTDLIDAAAMAGGDAIDSFARQAINNS